MSHSGSPYQSWQPGQSTAYSSPYGQPPPVSSGMSPAPPSYSGGPYGSGAPPASYGAPPTSYGAPPPSAPPASSYGAPPPSAPPAPSYGSAPGYGAPPSSQWAQPPSGYPYGYPQPAQPYGGQYSQVQFPQGTDPEIIRAFQGADRDGSGSIDDIELQKALSAGQPFSLRTVHLMLLQFANGAKKIGPTEFAALWKSLREWRGIFERFDGDRSGRIETGELRDALLSLGYAVPPSILQILVSKYDKTGQAKGLDYDNFVECGLVVKGLTEKFKEKDVKLTGSANLNYEAFMQIVLPFVVA